MPANRTLRYSLALLDISLAFLVLLLALDAVSDFAQLHGGLGAWTVVVAGIGLGLANLCFTIWILEQYPAMQNKCRFRRRCLCVTGTLLLLLSVAVSARVLVLLPAARHSNLAWTAIPTWTDWVAAGLGALLGAGCLAVANRLRNRP